VCQETAIAVARELLRFDGSTERVYFAWIYRIARNKAADHFGRQASDDRVEAMAQEELLQTIDTTANMASLSPEDRLDLEGPCGCLAHPKLIVARYSGSTTLPVSTTPRSPSYVRSAMITSGFVSHVALNSPKHYRLNLAELCLMSPITQVQNSKGSASVYAKGSQSDIL
jgi:hypothetical protein